MFCQSMLLEKKIMEVNNQNRYLFYCDDITGKSPDVLPSLRHSMLLSEPQPGVDTHSSRDRPILTIIVAAPP